MPKGLRTTRLLPQAMLCLLLGCGQGEDPSRTPRHAVGGAGSGAAAGATSVGGAGGKGGVSGAGGSAGKVGSTGGAGAAGASSAGRGGAAGTSGSSGTTGALSQGGAGAQAGVGGTGGTGGVPSGGSAGVGGEAGGDPGPLNVLAFSKTAEYRHDSIGAASTALVDAGETAGWILRVTEDASFFSDDALASVDVLVFLSTTGDVLNADQQAAFERFIRRGKGFVGIHSASDTEYEWAFYGELVGAYFLEHPPAIQEATVHIEDATHPTTAGLPAAWVRTDEWYTFQTNPRANVHVLMTLDESTYAPGEAAMGDDHPIAWEHEYEGGRAFYTALGHTEESYGDPLFMGHVTRAIEWAGGR